jgi:hypothetical protein
VKTVKQLKAIKALSPVRGAGDEHIEPCSMLAVASMMSSSSSSSDSSTLESTRVSEPNMDAAVSSAVVISGLELLMISEVPEPEATQCKVECERTELETLHGDGGSAGMSLD